MGDETYVVYVDLMGFADCLERLSDEDHQQLANVSLDHGGQTLLKGPALDIAVKYLTLNRAVEEVARDSRRRVDAAIIFSD